MVKEQCLALLLTAGKFNRRYFRDSNEPRYDLF